MVISESAHNTSFVFDYNKFKGTRLVIPKATSKEPSTVRWKIGQKRSSLYDPRLTQELRKMLDGTVKLSSLREAVAGQNYVQTFARKYVGEVMPPRYHRFEFLGDHGMLVDIRIPTYEALNIDRTVWLVNGQTFITDDPDASQWLREMVDGDDRHNRMLVELVESTSDLRAFVESFMGCREIRI